MRVQDIIRRHLQQYNTLENLPDQIRMGRELSDWTILYFISYALIAAFLIFNILISLLLMLLGIFQTLAVVAQERARVERRRGPRALAPVDREVEGD